MDLLRQEDAVLPLDDGTAVVTGGAVGVGRSLAAAPARAGAVVTICDVRPDVVQTAEELSVGAPDLGTPPTATPA